MSSSDFEKTLFSAMSSTGQSLGQCAKCPLGEQSRIQGLLGVIAGRCEWQCPEGRIPTRVVTQFGVQDRATKLAALLGSLSGFYSVPPAPDAEYSTDSIRAHDCGRLAAQLDDPSVVASLGERLTLDPQGNTISRTRMDGEILPPLRFIRER